MQLIQHDKFNCNLMLLFNITVFLVCTLKTKAPVGFQKLSRQICRIRQVGSWEAQLPNRLFPHYCFWILSTGNGYLGLQPLVVGARIDTIHLPPGPMLIILRVGNETGVFNMARPLATLPNELHLVRKKVVIRAGQKQMLLRGSYFLSMGGFI